MEARSCNNCCGAKPISTTYSECVSVALVPARNAHVPYCHLLCVPLYNILPHYLTNSTIFGIVLLIIKCVF